MSSFFVCLQEEKAAFAAWSTALAYAADRAARNLGVSWWNTWEAWEITNDLVGVCFFDVVVVGMVPLSGEGFLDFM